MGHIYYTIEVIWDGLSFFVNIVHSSVKNSNKIFTGPTYILLLSFTVILDVYQVIYAKWNYIYKVRSSQLWNPLSKAVNFTVLVGMQTEPISTSLGHSKLS